MSIHNADIAAIFEEIADLLEIEGENPFRIRAYRNAARTLRARGLRRLPVVDEHRHLLGIVTMDDVLGLLGQEIANLAEAVHLEVAKETGRVTAGVSGRCLGREFTINFLLRHHRCPNGLQLLTYARPQQVWEKR